MAVRDQKKRSLKHLRDLLSLKKKKEDEADLDLDLFPLKKQKAWTNRKTVWWFQENHRDAQGIILMRTNQEGAQLSSSPK